MTAHRRTRTRRWLAAALATVLATTGTVVASTTLAAPPAHAAYPETFNPFTMNGGFTVYAREDALLQNQETEGSIAVGGTATVQGSSGTYTIIHVSAGTGDYTLPTVDGDPTRLLVNSYSPASTGILAVTSAGTDDPALWGDLKMVERGGPWQAFARADWLRLNQNPANVDQTPLIDATHQQYPGDAAAPAGPAGENSIYTVSTAPTAVADYVEANREASYEEAADCLDGLATSDAGYPVGVAEDAGSRVVLEPLSSDRPNIVDYADIAGAALIQFSPGPAPGVPNPLIIRVAAGTTEVIGARSDPQGRYSPYMFWDLSQVTGDVTVRAGEARIDGSIYAPEASVTVDAAPLDGQVLGRDVTILGGEVHSFLFAGQLACEADSGTFAVRKELNGIAPGDLPEGTTFTVNYVATEPDGTVTVGTLEVPADGEAVEAGARFPVGTTIAFTEIAPESVPGWEWGSPVITPNPLEIGVGTAQVVVANSATAQTGTFSVAKTIDDVSGGSPAAPSQPTVPVTWTAFFQETQTTGTLQVPFDGTPVSVGQDFPVGTRIVLTEDLSGIDPPEGYEWSGVGWSPGRTFVIAENGSVVAVSLVNAVTPAAGERTITIVKSAEGEAADPAYGYAVSYNTGADLLDPRVTRALPVGDPESLDDVGDDVMTLALAELLPTLSGEPVDPADWALPVISVTADGTTTEYTPANFEGAGPIESAIVEIPLPESGDVLIDVTNAVKEGTFALAKRFQGVDGDDLPPGLEFSVRWTATTPAGDVTTGVVRVPADGTPVSPVDDTGAPIMFPYGTVITADELAPPAVRHVLWLETRFEFEQVVIGADDQPVVEFVFTNSANLVTDTFQVAKRLDGIDPAALLVDSFTIDYFAQTLGGTVETGSFEVPADGTPAGPVDEQGQPVVFPIGTVVHLAEIPPDPAALPPGYEWAETTWNPGASFTVGSGETPVLEVINSVEQFTQWAGTKVVEGDGASAVPAGTTFPIDWWWDHEPQESFEVEPDVVVYSPWFPVGSIIDIREGALPDIPGVDWGEPVWTVDGVALTPDADGKVTLPQTAVRTDGVAELTLTNTANGDLPATGGGAVSPLVPLGAIALILTGFALVARRRVA